MTWINSVSPLQADAELKSCYDAVHQALPIQFVNLATQLNYFERTFRPVMLPAHNDVAQTKIVAMVPELTAGKLEFNPNPLPFLAFGIQTALGLAIRVHGVDGLNDEAQLIADHAEQQHHALLVPRGMPEPAEIDRRAELGTVTVGRGSKPAQRLVP